MMARKSGKRWYIGGMNNSIPKEVIINMVFLPEGKFKLYHFEDTEKSHVEPTEINVGSENVEGGQLFKLRMEKGGGYAAYIEL